MVRSLDNPIKSILHDYCHVEWYEVNELADDVRFNRQEFDALEFKKQLERLIASSDDFLDSINQLTANEFSSSEEVHAWLSMIYRNVFAGNDNNL